MNLKKKNKKSGHAVTTRQLCPTFIRNLSATIVLYVIFKKKSIGNAEIFENTFNNIKNRDQRVHSLCVPVHFKKLRDNLMSKVKNQPTGEVL